jgi:hypothetical protein
MSSCLWRLISLCAAHNLHYKPGELEWGGSEACAAIICTNTFLPWQVLAAAGTNGPAEAHRACVCLERESGASSPQRARAGDEYSEGSVWRGTGRLPRDACGDQPGEVRTAAEGRVRQQ